MCYKSKKDFHPYSCIRNMEVYDSHVFDGCYENATRSAASVLKRLFESEFVVRRITTPERTTIRVTRIK